MYHVCSDTCRNKVTLDQTFFVDDYPYDWHYCPISDALFDHSETTDHITWNEPVDGSAWTVVWEGQFVVFNTEVITFFLPFDQWVELYIDDVPVYVQTTTDGTHKEIYVPFFVSEGVHNLRVVYYDDFEGRGDVSLLWMSETIPFDFIAPAAFDVLLIHGIWSEGDLWTNSGVNQLLEDNNYCSTVLDFCPSNGPIENEAIRIADEMEVLIGQNPDLKVDIVAHSMGGLAVRYYLAHQELWPMDDQGTRHHGVRKLITLGTPHEGTDIHLLHPIATNVLEFQSAYGSLPLPMPVCSLNYYLDVEPYNFMVWSPALRQMTAKWKPPQTWKDNPVGASVAPMEYLELQIPDLLAGPTPDEWWRLSELFPSLFPLTCLKNHIKYYDQMIGELTTFSGTSPFLEDLNAISIPQDIEYYLVAGNRLTFYKLWRFEVLGEYGDGVVPEESALGLGLVFPPTTTLRTVYANHLELPTVCKNLILEFLNQ